MHPPRETSPRPDVLIAGALAYGRPAALAEGEPRPDGSNDDAVAASYGRLRDLVWRRAEADPRSLARLHELEPVPPGAAWSRLNTIVMLIDADEDAEIIDAARDVWTALGPTLYGLHLTPQPRPKNYLGFLEGRLWLVAPILGWALIGVMTDSYGWPSGLTFLLVVAWPCVVLTAFVASVRARMKIPGKQLPHL